MTAATKTTKAQMKAQITDILPIGRKTNVIDYAIKARRSIIDNCKCDDASLSWLDFLTALVYAEGTGRINPDIQFALYDTKGSKSIKLLINLKRLGLFTVDELARFLNQKNADYIESLK